MVPDTVLGQVAGEPTLPDVGLVVGPPRTYPISSPNILESTWTGDNIDTMRHLAADRHGQRKPSWVVGGGDDGGEETFLADLAIATWGFVEAFLRSLLGW